MKKRIFTIFGVHIPPWKEEKLGSKSTTIRFVLTGKIPSKKNNQQAVAVRKHARAWANEQAKVRPATWADVHKAIGMVFGKMRGNKEYKDFLDKVRPVLQEQSAYWAKQLAHKNLTFPIDKSTLSLRLHFKDRYVTDTVNKQQTIQDVLQDCCIIKNDDYQSLNPIHSASASYYEEIVKDIASITISFKL
jgi:hypothetical protein